MNERFEIKTAYHVLIESAWFLTFVFDHKHGQVTVLEYERDHLMIDRNMPKCKVIEDDKRNIIAIEYEGCTLEVLNPRYVFDYK